MAYLGQKANLLYELKTVLIIAPHPDDEILGCGGLLAGRTDNGRKTYILFLTNGEASHNGCCATPSREIAVKRRHLAVNANDILGCPSEHLYFLNERDGCLPRKGQDDFIELTKKIAECLEKLAPEAIFCPHPFEGWTDHIASQELTMAAIEMLYPHSRPRLYHYCVWFWYGMSLKRVWFIDWKRARLLDISSKYPLKQQALRTYMDALAPCGQPWVGKLQPQFLKSFDWNKELFFES